MHLARIAPAEYRLHFAAAAKARWRKNVSDKAVDSILALTQRHPYYVNALCSRLWEAARPPTPEQVNSAWLQIAEQDTAIVAHQVRSLSATQRAMLVGMARAGRVEFPLGRAFLAGIRLSASTGAGAKDVLEAADLIRQASDKHWELVDPVMAAYLRGFTPD